MATSSHHRQEPGRLRLESLVDHAVLAPSSHNTQPWRFDVSGGDIRVFVDRDRWLRTADPDQRELYVSAGCALENLLVAAAHHRYQTSVSYVNEDRADGLAAVARFQPRGRAEDGRVRLFGALRRRRTNRRPYDRRPLAPEVVTRLQAAVLDDGVQLWLITDAETSVRHLQAKTALRPSAPGKDVALLRTAPALGVLTSLANDRGAQVRVGQAFERLALTATSLGVAVQPMSALLEGAMARAAMADLLPEEVFPQHAFRLGYAPPERRRSPRRPVAEVLRSAKEEFDS